MAKVSVNLEDDFDSDEATTKVRELAAPLPSVSKAKSAALKDAPRVQISAHDLLKATNRHTTGQAQAPEQAGTGCARPPVQGRETPGDMLPSTKGLAHSAPKGLALGTRARKVALSPGGVYFGGSGGHGVGAVAR